MIWLLIICGAILLITVIGVVVFMLWARRLSDVVVRQGMFERSQSTRTINRAATMPGQTVAEHPELGRVLLLGQAGVVPIQTRAQGAGVDVPPNFEADIAEAERLKAYMHQDPRAIISVIQIYERVLDQLRPGEHPTFCAAVQSSLGNAYWRLPVGDREDNLARAIACFLNALSFWTAETAPYHYAQTQNNLGNAYSELPTGDQADNLARAIACYQEALRFRTLETAPREYADTQQNLGLAYAQLLTGDREKNLRQAIACYQEALRFQTPKTAPYDYAIAQSALGAAYAELRMGDQEANLARAIECYREALRFQTPQTTPNHYAGTQMNLGVAYAALPTGKREENLAHAIECFQETLRIYTLKTAPREYAGAKHNLGLAYADLQTGDRGTNLVRAIECYQEALRVETPQTAPYEYAMIQNNLANAYRKLPTGDRGANMVRAIECCQEALRVWTPQTAPYEYAGIQHTLGNTYLTLPIGDRGANMVRAIECYQEALRVWSPQTAPRDYALVQTNLGNAYAQLQTGDPEANLRLAIECYQEALRFRTPETAPHDYAMTQHSLGTAHSNLTNGNRATNLVRAIECYQEALRFCTPETASHECRMTNRNLAILHSAQKDWDAALVAYQAAMGAGERLYRSGLSTESKATEVAENAPLYQNAAFATARLQDPTQALLTLERGKTRLLAEALRLRIPRPDSVPDAVWVAFEQAGAAVRAVQSENMSTLREERDPVQTYAAREQAARAAGTALDRAVEQVRKYAPDFVKDMDLQTIQELLSDDHTALVAFCITEQGSMGLIVHRNHDPAVQMVDVPEFTQTSLNRLLFAQTDDKQRGESGWIKDYLRYRNEQSPVAFEVWQTTINSILSELSHDLLAPILAVLPPSVERLIFLPSGGLFLLPLHAIPLPNSGSLLICDRYEVSYAPSVEVLVNSCTRAARANGHDLCAVINPSADPQLIFTSIEGVAISEIFARHRILQGRAGTKEAIVFGVPGHAYVHFSCHGSYNWDNPPASHLVLADGHFTLAELQRGVVDLSATRLVTLAACETGVTDVMKGSADEYVGLPAGFMLAGVPCVVSSLWSVPDISTALLMERFYHNHLKGGMHFATALREAQLWVRNATARELGLTDRWEQIYQASDRHNKDALKWMRYYSAHPDVQPFDHPYYWAAFTVNGM